MKTNSTLFTILLFICLSGTSLAQAPEIEWNKSIRGSWSDGWFSLTSMTKTQDGGILFWVKSGGYWLVKTDRNGVKLWEKNFAITLAGENASDPIISTTDSCYLLAGTTWGQCDDFWVSKTNADGDVLWEKTYGGSGCDVCSSLTNTPDGGYLIVGCSPSPVSGDKSDESRGRYDYWVLKIDANGNKIWDKTYGGSSYEGYAVEVATTPDGGYILASSSDSNSSGDKTEDSNGGVDYWIVRIDEEGKIIWDKTLGGAGADYCTSLLLTPDGGCIVGGRSNSDTSGDKTENSKGGYDYWIVKLGEYGNILWDKTIGGDGADYCTTLLEVEGGVVVGGSSDSVISEDKTENSKGERDYWLVKLNSNGYKVWDKSIGGTGSEDCLSVISTSDDGILVTGTSNSPISGDKTENLSDNDIWLVSLTGPDSPDSDSPVIICPDDIVVSQDSGQNGAIVDYELPLAFDENGYGFESLLLPGYTYGGTYNGHTYFVSNSLFTPEQAKALAASVGGHLATITSEDENTFIAGLNSDMMWIGYSDSESEGKWIWDTGEEADFTNWYPGEPNNSGGHENWAVINFHSKSSWNDLCASRKAKYVVEFDGMPVPVSLVSGLASGSVFPLGTSEIVYEATDLYGNTTKCSFYVTVTGEAEVLPAPKITWEKSYPGIGLDGIYYILPMANGGFLLRDSSRDDCTVVAIDSLGNVLWVRDIIEDGYGDLYNSAENIIASPDGNYLTVGSTRKNSKGRCDYLIVKFDENGNILWERTFGGDDSDWGMSVVNSKDGGYLVAGYSESLDSGDKTELGKADDIWIVKIDCDGNKVWDKTLFADFHQPYLISLPDGGYLVMLGEEFMAYKVDADGNLLNKHYFDIDCFSPVFSVSQGLVENYFMAGYAKITSNSPSDPDNYNGRNYDYRVLKLNADGAKIWDKLLGGARTDEGTAVVGTPDGGCYIVGNSNSDMSTFKTEDSKGGTDIWVLKLDADGEVEWDKTIGGIDSDFAYSVAYTSDGGCLIGGEGSRLIKLGGDGIDNSMPPIITCSKNIVVSQEMGLNGATVNYDLPLAFDENGYGSESLLLSGYTYGGTYNGHTYFLSDSLVTPELAIELAASVDGHLATITSEGENAFIAGLSSKMMWIGFSDMDTEGDWTWSTDENVGFTNWYQGEPNNSGGHENWAAINFHSNGSWNDLCVSREAKYVVEFDGTSVPVSLISGFASGAVFPLGTTEVIYEASDFSGNSAQCSFNVTVVEGDDLAAIDTMPPVFYYIFNVQTLAASGSNGAVVWYEKPFAIDENGDGSQLFGFPEQQYVGVYENHTYLLSYERSGAEAAIQSAEATGGHLVTISGAKENEFVAGLSSEPMWIGFSDNTIEGSWKWGTGEPVGFTNWYTGEPNNCGGAENWAAINYHSLASWNDLCANRELLHVLEFDGTTVPVTLVSGLPPGSFFPLGETEVVYEAIDPSGNRAECSFLVTVLPPEPQVVSSNSKSARMGTEADAIGDHQKTDFLAYPNPFRDQLKFEFTTPEDLDVKINLYDLTGRLVETIFNQAVTAGVTNTVEYFPDDDGGKAFIYQVVLGDEKLTGKVIQEE